MQQAKVFGRLLIFAHGVGDARAGVHAGERGADQGQEHGKGLDQHEDAAMAIKEMRCPR